MSRQFGQSSLVIHECAVEGRLPIRFPEDDPGGAVRGTLADEGRGFVFGVEEGKITTGWRLMGVSQGPWITAIVVGYTVVPASRIHQDTHPQLCRSCMFLLPRGQTYSSTTEAGDRK